MKQQINVYGKDPVSPIEIRQSVVKDGVVRYNNKHFRIFHHNGLASIQADDPITHPIHKYDDDEIINRALYLLNRRIMQGPLLESPDAVKYLLTLRNHEKTREVFTVIFLNNRHKVVSIYDHTQGDLSSSAVYPHVIVKEALRVGSNTWVLSHNHPSACSAEPSRTDKEVTARLQKAATLFSMKRLDHIITADAQTYSFAENGVI